MILWAFERQRIIFISPRSSDISDMIRLKDFDINNLLEVTFKLLTKCIDNRRGTLMTSYDNVSAPLFD